jgi:chemotaxis family two-component system response regulator Rcp1
MSRVFDLLIVDDDPGQFRLMKSSLGELGLKHRCHYACSGYEAIAFLKHWTPFEDAPRPDLILLDLNMPGMDGCEVVRRIKTDPLLGSIPVLVLSSSEAAQDVEACYGAHANVYIQKPADLPHHVDMVRRIHRFWAESAVVPRSFTAR